jgi:hypothetical protein
MVLCVKGRRKGEIAMGEEICERKERGEEGEASAQMRQRRGEKESGSGQRERESVGERVCGNLMRGRWGVFNGKVGFSVVVWSGQTCGISF